MIDDEKLQELLAKASSLYHNGQYPGAIAAWKEALSIDPRSQKAREGIRMATLLMGDFQADAAEPAPPSTPADGADPGAEGMPEEETEARLDLGIAKVKQLIAERKYDEAIDGARSLLPLEKEPGELQRLLDEAQQGFESAPFIEEHLTLSRELLAQDRFPEAEAECKKVFVLDQEHPGARTLLLEIRSRTQESLEKAASRIGGMTVKLSLPEVQAAARSVPAPRPAAGTRPAAADPVDPAEVAPAFAERPPLDNDLDALDLSAFTVDGENAARQEEVAARAALESAFEQSGVGEAESPAGLDPAFAERPPLDGEPVTAAATPATPAPAEPEIVEATTVRPPNMRSVIPPATPEPKAGKPAKAVGKASPATAKASKTTPSQAKTPPPGSEPASGEAGAAAPGDAPLDAAAGWETELTQLNIREGERSLLKGTAAAKLRGAKAARPQDPDLMALLDGDPLGGSEEPISAIPLAAPATPSPNPVEEKRKRSSKHRRADAAGSEEPDEREEPSTERARPDRGRAPRPPAPRGGSSWLRVFLVLVVVALAGAGWVVMNNPSILDQIPLGRWLGRSQPAAPPAGSSSGLDPGQNPIPTPLGGTSRQQPRGDLGAAGVPPSPEPDPDAGQAAPAAAAAGIGAPAGAAPPPRSNEPIKPAEAPPISKAEARQRIQTYTADGKRLMQAGKWREARAKFAAVLALDPVNFEVKDLLDQVQARLDEEIRLMDEFESAKKMFNERDYENALRKFYRLPQDRGLGDISLFIRNAWFNWSILLMKGGNAAEALQKLSEVLTLDPDDSEAIRLQEVAEKYGTRAKDRVYFAFTDTLRLRAIDQK